MFLATDLVQATVFSSGFLTLSSCWSPAPICILPSTLHAARVTFPRTNTWSCHSLPYKLPLMDFPLSIIFKRDTLSFLIILLQLSSLVSSSLLYSTHSNPPWTSPCSLNTLYPRMLCLNLFHLQKSFSSSKKKVTPKEVLLSFSKQSSFSECPQCWDQASDLMHPSHL